MILGFVRFFQNNIIKKDKTGGSSSKTACFIFILKIKMKKAEFNERWNNIFLTSNEGFNKLASLLGNKTKENKQKEQTKLYYQLHKEEKKEYQRKYRQTKSGKEVTRKYYLSESYKLVRKKYYENHKEEIKLRRLKKLGKTDKQQKIKDLKSKVLNKINSLDDKSFLNFINAIKIINNLFEL